MNARSKKTSTRTSRSPKSLPQPESASVESAVMAIARAMKSIKAQWYLFGAQAVALHGAQRTTQDVDVTVLTEKSTAQLIAALKREKIVPRFSDAAFIEQTRVVPCDHGPSGWKIDVVLGSPGLEEFFASQAQLTTLGKTKAPLLRLEHLLVLKTLAGRPQDVADIDRLLKARSDVELTEVRALLMELERGLAEDGLVSRFDRIASPRW